MAKRITQKILAIDPGTRELGYALLDQGQLIYYGVKSFPRQGSPQERLRHIRATISRMITDFQPDLIAVERTFFGRNKHAQTLHAVSKLIQVLGKRNGIPVSLISSSMIKKHICGHGRLGKRDLAKAIIARHPELRAYAETEKLWIAKFHANMLDAIGLGLTAHSQPENA